MTNKMNNIIDDDEDLEDSWEEDIVVFGRCPIYRLPPDFTVKLRNKVVLNRQEDLICLLCYDYVKENEPIFMIEECRHVYHSKCVRRWFIDYTNCPNCDITPEDRR
ncbi:RING-H2 finger protein ATL79 [Nosema granulosis]|uniref:RING-H2 finger protein ATL79 n=1 Tax=Nosema granulosis TaxID=83296 RepID=A0A9P6KZ18_9MICR|nr:RING-H2 finger protein ATL79 [Nosema granulosis]